MLIIKNKTQLNKFKKVEGEELVYEFDEDVEFIYNLTFKTDYEKVKDEKLKECKTNTEKILFVLNEKYRPRIIFKGKSMTFHKDVEWIDEIQLEGSLKCFGDISGKIFDIGKNVEAKKKIVCTNLDCTNLSANYAKIDNLFCRKNIKCEMLDTEHIISCAKLNADVLTFNGSMLYNVSANGEDLNVQKNGQRNHKRTK